MEYLKYYDSTLKRRNGQIAGVCGGLGAHFNANPSILRFLFVLLFLGGIIPGLLPYLICWIVIPKAEEGLSMRVWN